MTSLSSSLHFLDPNSIFIFGAYVRGVIFGGGGLYSEGILCQYLRMKTFKIYYNINEISILLKKLSFFQQQLSLFCFTIYLNPFWYLFYETANISCFREIFGLNLIFVYYLISRGGLYLGGLYLEGNLCQLVRGLIFGGAYIRDFTVQQFINSAQKRVFSII